MKQNPVVNNLYEIIESAPLDEEVGIRIAPLTGNDELSLLVAEIGPRRKVGAHYHESGIETYQIVEGEGEMRLGAPDGKNTVKWSDPFQVKIGDCFTVEEGVVHQLENTLDSRLIIVVGCSKSHVTTDRITVNG
jgi:mannose-6-phosphate isomerase-like protein (cupin superfamily)